MPMRPADRPLRLLEVVKIFLAGIKSGIADPGGQHLDPVPGPLKKCLTDISGFDVFFALILGPETAGRQR
jgi:hypothetical protein